MSIEQYFGKDGAFAEACHIYMTKTFPQTVALHAASLETSRFAFSLGWCFAKVLKRRQMSITDEDLWTIAKTKISSGDPKEFVNGFKSYGGET